MINLPEKYKFLDLSDENFSMALDKILNTNEHLNIIGPAGVGKSQLLKLCADLLPGNTVTLASTGVASANASSEGIKGSTIHSFFKFAPLDIYSSSQLRIIPDLFPIINNVDTILMDEVGMVNASLFDFIIETLLLYRSKQEKGLPRIILFNDVLQLSPIIKNDGDIKKYFDTMYEGKVFYFNSFSYRDMGFTNIHLNKIYRQKEGSFQNILNRIRQGTQTSEDLKVINEKVISEEKYFMENEYYMYLCSTNKIADEINSSYLHTFEGESKTYRGYVNGKFDFKKFPHLQQEVTLKKDVQVMTIKNNPVGYQNGTIGKVVNMFSDGIEIETKDGIFVVGRSNWENYEYSFDEKTKIVEVEKVGSFNMLEAKSCLALTTFKAQGLTLENIFVDLTFTTFGLTYVALSRCKTLEGIGLKRPITNSMIKVHPEALEFLSSI